MADSDLDDSISRLTAWTRDFGHRHTDVFNRDILNVVEAARKFRNQKPAEEVLLSEEFLKKFAAAFAVTPFPEPVFITGSAADLRGEEP